MNKDDILKDFDTLAEAKRKGAVNLKLCLGFDYLDAMKRGKESGNFNINQTIYSTPINLISLTRRIRTEHCQLFIHITSGR